MAEWFYDGFHDAHFVVTRNILGRRDVLCGPDGQPDRIDDRREAERVAKALEANR